MKKWVLILIVFFFLAVAGKLWGGGIFGLMQPPSFHTPEWVSGDTRVTRNDDTRFDRADNTRIIR